MSHTSRKQLKDGLKECTTCKIYKPLTEYYPRKNSKTGEFYPNGKSSCIECDANARTKWVYNNKEYDINRKKVYRLNNRMKVIEHYGGKCFCCGESQYEFMTLDHTNGGGTQHRLSLGSNGKGQNFYKWIIRNNYPEGFRILCHNCNASFGLYNYCPHKKESLFMTLENFEFRMKKETPFPELNL